MIFKVRPSEIASWPSWELDLLEEFMAREPPAEARVEIAVAKACELFLRSKGIEKVNATDFLLFLDAWAHEQAATDSRYSAVDREVFGAFAKG